MTTLPGRSDKRFRCYVYRGIGCDVNRGVLPLAKVHVVSVAAARLKPRGPCRLHEASRGHWVRAHPTVIGIGKRAAARYAHGRVVSGGVEHLDILRVARRARRDY